MTLGPYVVRERIAEGGMAALFLAERDGRPVALKMIREELARSEEFRTMFLDEARIVGRLEHPNIVRTLDFGVEGKQPYIVMELLSGRSLREVWNVCRERGVRLRYEMIAWIGACVAAGLHHAHEQRDPQGQPLHIVHRDLDGTNVFVTYEGVIKVIDFGLAKAANRASRTATGIIKGKVAYMSPEQATGDPVDRRTDIFALGTILWELACDRRLFKGDDDIETLRKVRDAKVPDATQLVAGFPPALWEAIRPALARDREDRYATAAEMGRALHAFAGASMSDAAVAEVMRELFPAGGAAAVPRAPALVPVASSQVAVVAPARRLAVIVLVIALVVATVISLALALR